MYQEWTKLFIERDLSIACYCNGSSSDIPHYIAKGVAPDENSSKLVCGSFFSEESTERSPIFQVETFPSLSMATVSSFLASSNTLFHLARVSHMSSSPLPSSPHSLLSSNGNTPAQREISHRSDRVTPSRTRVMEWLTCLVGSVSRNGR